MIVNRLIELELLLRKLRQEWDAAAFRDDFAEAERLQKRHDEADNERRRILATLTQVECAEFEKRREELKQAS